MAARTFREKKSFFPLNFNVYINLDNRERARARVNNNGDKFLWKKNVKIVYESCFFANARAKFFC